MTDLKELILIALCGVIVGICGTIIYLHLSANRFIDGMYIQQDISKSEAMDYAQNRDTVGKWVCINIRGMTVPEIITTCQHEAAHEIFAQKCEKNPLGCVEMFE